MTLQTLSLISLGLGVVAYLALTVFCIVTWARGITGRAAFAASAVSLLFMLSLGLTGISAISMTVEPLALVAWMILLMRVIGIGWSNASDQNLRPVVAVFVIACALGLASMIYPWVLALGRAAAYDVPVGWLFACDVLFAICGLVMLEQVVRNTRDDYRWRLRYLNIGVGTLFVFLLVHNALALMLGGHLPALLVIKPAVYAMAVPFIAIASVRNPANPLRLNLSRRFVFRGGTLMATGLGLLLLGFLGYLVQVLEGDWGAAILALTATVAVLATLTVSGSTTVRARVRRLLEEHLFAQRYDYREQWRRVTEQLTEPSPDYDLPQQVLRALGGILQSHAGAVWRLSPQGLLVPLSRLHTHWDQPLTPQTSTALKTFFEQREWVLDLEDLPASAREALAGATELKALPAIRYLVPLMTEKRLFGVAALANSQVPRRLSWEDYDVLKFIARQASGFIALQEAERELADADKLRSFNQVSAFIVHDVKTISSQLSLLTQNAAKHKSNPAFVDDMVATVGNAVDRMQKLLTQLRDGETRNSNVVDLNQELERTVQSFQQQSPAPRMHQPDKPLTVAGDPSKLRSAVGHVVQNAIDAANLKSRGDTTGRVAVTLTECAPWAEITVEDSGPGMDPQFIENSLFQPFTSTKGVAGMGVGAYQARSYIRSLGGDISVHSRPGKGSRFTIRLPLKAAHD